MEERPIGEELLRYARDALCLRFPYLDTALYALNLRDGGGMTLSLATDGETLYYDAGHLSDKYLRNPLLVERAYLHTVLHCMLRHLGKKHGKMPELWDLACDAAVESLLDELLPGEAVPARRKFYGECRQELKVLTAEGIYRHLLRRDLSPYELAVLHRQFLADDHGLWDLPRRDGQQEQQDRRWKEVSERTRTGLETVLAGQAQGGGEAVLEQVRAAVREDVDYRAFLRRFAVHREILAVDGDAFDPVFYTYGLRLYGNLPLVEPVETREEKRIEDFVLALDTSMSTSGELVRAFLAVTYAILRSTGTFTRKVHIRVIQCDDRIRSDTEIRDLSELRELMENFQLRGGSATDFRPVFEYVERLRREGAFSSLRGLVYLTDGMGIYPKRRPAWETAFVFLEEPPMGVEIPPWAMRLNLSLSDLGRAARETDLDGILDPEELPEL